MRSIPETTPRRDDEPDPVGDAPEEESLSIEALIARSRTSEPRTSRSEIAFLGVGSPFGSPLPPPRRSGPARPLWLAGLALLLSLGAMGTALAALRRSAPPAPEVALESTSDGRRPEPAAVRPEPSSHAQERSEEEPSGPVAEEASSEPASSEPASSEPWPSEQLPRAEAPAPAVTGEPTSRVRTPRRERSASAESPQPRPASEPETAPVPYDRDAIDAVLDRALDGRGVLRAEEESALPELPTREAVLGALRAVEDRVAQCAGTRTGLATVNVQIEGATGRVRHAQVQGDFAGTVEGSCIARAVREARVPRFAREQFEVRFPYRLGR